MHPRPLGTGTAMAITGTVTDALDTALWFGLRDRGESTAREDGGAVVFGQATPDAVRLADAQGVLGAHAHDGAAGADGLRGGFARLADGAALAFRMEEQAGILPAAGSLELPVPKVGIRSGQSRDICHGRSPAGESALVAARMDNLQPRQK